MPQSKRRLPAIITPDGPIDPATLGEISFDKTTGAPVLQAHAVISFRSDFERALARDLNESDELDLIGKSGHSRVLSTIRQRPDEEIVFENRNAIVPIDVLSLRAVEMRRNGVQDEFLRVLTDMVHEGRREVPIGRLALAARENALSKDDILDAIHKHRLLLPPQVNPEECIDDDGVIKLPLEDLQYLFCEANFDEDAQRRVIRFGKHGLSGLQERVDGLPDELRGRQAMVGGIKISIGPYIVIIDSETNQEGVQHLAARVLDGIRTTGIDVIRQVELFNSQLNAVSTEDLKVRLRVYHATKEVQDFSDVVVNPRTISSGVSFPEVIEVGEHPERLIQIIHQVSPTNKDGGPYGYLVGADKSIELQWQQHPNFQDRNLRTVSTKFVAGDPKYCLTGNDVPHFARDASSVLRYVGRDQNEGRMSVTWGFPDPDVMEYMLYRGTGVFVAHDLKTREDAFTGDEPIEKAEFPPKNEVYFDGQRFAAFQSLYKNGARFFMVRHEQEDTFTEDKVLPEEVLEWDRRGFWLRPSAKERFEKIDTIVAMYGSHTDGMEDLLRAQLTGFSLRMKERFGDSLAFIHGKGPGVMYIADDIARNLVQYSKGNPEFDGKIEEGIASIGVGISAEHRGQAPNFNPPAQIDFAAKDRLIRQKHMNDRSTINIFNIGGAGTLEEIAITLCSQKLLKNIPAPMIFVDPMGLASDGSNLWKKLEVLICDLAEAKVITQEQAGVGQDQVVQLLQPHMANFIHVVDSYDEAADLIINFADDPVKYYKEVAKMPYDEVISAYCEAADTFCETGFPMPKWANLGKISEDPRWDEE